MYAKNANSPKSAMAAFGFAAPLAACLFLSSCSGSSFSGRGGGGKSEPKPEQAETVADPDKPEGGGDAAGKPADLLPLCDDVSRVKTKTLTLNFPYNEAGCDWGVDGNYTKDSDEVREKQSIMSATDRQDMELDVPVVCGLEIGSDESEDNFKYDDEIYFLLNDRILMTSYNLPDRPLATVFAQQDGLSVFDFSKVRGTSYEDGDATLYCLPGAECKVPKSDTAGSFSLKFPDAVVRKLIGKGKDRYVFSFVTIGEDDPDSDCRHSNIDLKFTVKYVDAGN